MQWGITATPTVSMETEIMTGQLANIIVFSDLLVWMHLRQDKIQEMHKSRERQPSQESTVELGYYFTWKREVADTDLINEPSSDLCHTAPGSTHLRLPYSLQDSRAGGFVSGKLFHELGQQCRGRSVQ